MARRSATSSVVCTACAFPPVERFGEGHDYGLWPECPGGDRGGHDKPGTVARVESDSPGAVPDRAPLQVVEEPEPTPEPDPVLVQGMMQVPVASEPDWTNLADIDGPSWGPGN